MKTDTLTTLDTTAEEFGAFLVSEQNRLAEELGPRQAQETLQASLVTGLAWWRFTKTDEYAAVLDVMTWLCAA
jgi:hypothetical protein